MADKKEIKIAKPDCFGKYPENPTKKCRTCKSHVDCKVKSQKKK